LQPMGREQRRYGRKKKSRGVHCSPAGMVEKQNRPGCEVGKGNQVLEMAPKVGWAKGTYDRKTIEGGCGDSEHNAPGVALNTAVGGILIANGEFSLKNPGENLPQSSERYPMRGNSENQKSEKLLRDRQGKPGGWESGGYCAGSHGLVWRE